MKALVLVATSLSFFAPAYAQQGWVEVASSSEISLGIDPGTIVRSGQTRLAWVVTVDKTGKYAGTYVLSRRWFNCVTRTYGTRSTVVRNSATHQVIDSYQLDEDQYAHDVVPGSILDGVLEAVCR